MKNKLLIIFIAFIFLGCKDKFDDKSKRNENWVWWTDAKTGKSSWIPVNRGEPVKNGKYIRFYANGNKFRAGTLKGGVDVDTIFYYDMNGVPEEYKIAKDSTEYFFKNGPIKLVFIDGSLSATGIVKNHTYGDKWISYFFSSKKPRSIKNLKNDTGWVTYYYENGNVKDSDYYEGKNSFNIKHWYDNGQLEIIDEFRNHNFNGIGKKFYRDGKLKALGYNVDGKVEGEEKFWYENGKIQAIEHKVHDVLDGQQIIYYENGQIQVELMAKDGKRDGECKKCDEDGKLIVDVIFKDGIAVENK